MKKVLVKFKVANDIVGEGYWDFWLDQGQDFASWGKRAVEAFSKATGSWKILEQRWEKLSLEDRKQMYGDDFLFYGFRVLNEVWIDYEIMDIEGTVENEFTLYPCVLKSPEGKLVRLQKHITGKKSEKTYFYFNNEELDIHSCSETEEGLLEEVKENLMIAYDLYVDCDEDELSNSGKALRRKLQEYFEEVK